jgi:hypothetical protein
MRAAVIGAVALALRNCPRQTEDVDLASFAAPRAYCEQVGKGRALDEVLRRRVKA